MARAEPVVDDTIYIPAAELRHDDELLVGADRWEFVFKTRLSGSTIFVSTIEGLFEHAINSGRYVTVKR